MAFVLNLNVNAGNAVATVNQVQTGLGKATVAAGQGRNAMGQFTAGAQAAGAAGAKAGEDTAKGMERAKAATEGSSDALSRLIHLAEAYIAVHQVESIVDGYVEIRNKTNSVATSAANLNALMNEQFAIAQETRSGWEGLASTYQRISNAGRGLGLSQQQIINLTRELSQGLRLSGSSAFEANMTMMELTHAFTVGALTGREFRVMMKDAPALMHELQVVSGKTGAEFAEMGKHGKFTAQQLVEWFDKAKVTIADKFGQTIPTIAEGFLLIRNAAQKFFGEAGLGTGVVQGLGAVLRSIAEHMDTVGKATLAVVEALLGLFVIEKIIVMVRALTVAIAANPLGALVTALTVSIALLRQFGDQMETTTKSGTGFVTIADTMGAAWSELKRLASDLFDTIMKTAEAWRRLFAGDADVSGFEKSTTTVTDLINAMVARAVGMLRFLGDMTVTIFGGIPASIGEMFVNMAKAVVHEIESLVNKVIQGVNLLIDAKNAIMETPFDSQIAKMTREKYENDVKNLMEKNARPGESLYDRFGMRGRSDQLTSEAIDYGKRSGIQPPELNAGTGHIAPVDLSFTTALDGAAAAFDRKIKEDWQKDITDGIARVTDESIRRAQQRQFEGYLKYFSDQAGGGIGQVGGKPDAKLPNEKEAHKAEKAFEKLENQLRTVTEASNPQSAAIEKLAHAHEILEKAVAAVNPHTREHLITAQAAAQVYENLKARLEDQLHPFEAWVRKQGEATAALRDTNEEQDRAAKLTAFVAEMRQKTGGLEVDPAEIAVAQRQIELAQRRVEIMHAEQGITEAVLGPQHTYQVQLAAIGDLLERGRINADQYNQAIDAARVAYLAASQGTHTFGVLVEAAWLKAKEEARAAGVAIEAYSRVVDEVRAKQLAAGPEGRTFGGAMEAEWLKAKMAAEDFGATLATTLVGDLDKLNDALITMASTGEVSFRRLIGSMLQELAKLALKMLEVRALGALFDAFGGVASGPDKIGLANQMAEAMGYSTGGTAMVGGIGGVDSQFIALRATPGERVTVETQYQQQQNAAGPAPAVNLKVVNQMDREMIHAEMDSPEGEQIFLNFLRRNPGAIRSYSGARK